ncbi:MAG TPA: hypothetical protein VGN81_31530 [Pseudonocardiaceae bacterium]|jgi:hypothetical protein
MAGDPTTVINPATLINPAKLPVDPATCKRARAGGARTGPDHRRD